jgi:hypothetical protein
MSDDEHDRSEAAQPIREPLIIIDEQREMGYALINGQRLKMGQRMYDDRQLRSIVLQQQQIEIEQAKAENKQLRGELLYKHVIEKFNRAHGQNRKISLRQVCAQMGVSYDAVRQYRSREQKRKTKK